MGEAALAAFVAAMFSMMNPVGNLGIFSSMTADRSPAEARGVALTCALSAAAILLIATWFGGAFLAFFGITIDALRTAGGIIILLIGLSMLRKDDSHRHTPDEAQDGAKREQIGIVPLAMPIVAGPGSIAAVMVAAEHNQDLLSRAEISIVVVAMAALCGACFAASRTLAGLLGTSGMGVVTRIMGMILCAIAVGTLADGLKGLFPVLVGTS